MGRNKTKQNKTKQRRESSKRRKEKMAAVFTLNEEEQELLRQKRQQRQDDEEREASEASLRAQAVGAIDQSENDELTEEAVAHATELLRRYGKSVQSIKLAPGSSSSGMGPRVIMVKGTTKMQGADVFDMSAPFLNTGMIPLDGVRGTQEDVRATYSAQLVKFVTTLTPHSPKVSTHFHSTGDKAPWAPFFPTRKAHIGIYFDGKRYYLIASMHAGENLANDLAAIANEPEMTARGLTKDARIRWIEDVSSRNVKRVLYEAATALGVPVTYGRDTSAAVHGIPARPNMAITCHHSVHNSFDVHHNGKDVSIYHKVHHKRTCTGPTLTHGGHFHGYAVGHHHMGLLTTPKHHKKHRHCPKKRKVQQYYARVHHLGPRDTSDPDIIRHQSFPDGVMRYRSTFVVTN